MDMDGVRIDKVLVQQVPPPSDREQSEAALAMRAVLPASAQAPENQQNNREQPNKNGQE
jgi:hypothetical protein